ncbi:MAG: hypothetical protein KJ651_07085, partial [Gammaproteobacteria bacterium]|nr:hypothetical protein [Gammaproteobacteria bacterium]
MGIAFSGGGVLDTGLANKCVRLMTRLYPLTCRLGLMGFAPLRASHFLLLAQEKVTKEKGTPPSGPGYAGIPSFHHR